MDERGVNVIVKRDYEIVGIPKDEAIEYRKARRTYTSEQGYMEAANWVDANFPEPAKAKAWLKERRPDLYDKLFPASREMTPRQREIYEKMRGESVGKSIREFLEDEPEDPRRVLGQGRQHQPAALHAPGGSEVSRTVSRRQPMGRHGSARHVPGRRVAAR